MSTLTLSRFSHRNSASKRKSSTLGLYSQATNYASVKAAHPSGVSGFWRIRAMKLVAVRAFAGSIPDFTSCSSNDGWLLLARMSA